MNSSSSNLIVIVSESEFSETEFSETEFSSSQEVSVITDSDSDMDDFDVTDSSLGVPEERERSRSPLMSLLGNRNWSWTPRVSPKRRR